MSLELQNEVLLREASDGQKTETLKEQAYQLMHQALKEMQEAMLISFGRRLRLFESVNTLAEGLKAHRHRVVRLEQRLATAQRLLATRPAAPPSPPSVLLTLVHAPPPLARPARSYSQDNTHQPAGAAAPSPACCGSSSSASCGGAAWPVARWRGGAGARGRGARVPPPPEENEHLNEGAPRAARRPPPFKVCALSRELLRAAGDGAEGAVRALLARGADVRWRNASRWTPLHAAARGGHVHVLALLLRCGADVCARTRYGYTALHLAAYNDARGACVRRLVRAGAPLDAANRWGRAPLHAAAAAANLPAALTLVAAGADRAATDHQGKTPFALAASDVMRGLLLF